MDRKVDDVDRDDEIMAHASACALDAVKNGWWEGDSVYGIPDDLSNYQPDEFSADWEDFCERFGEADGADECDGYRKRCLRVGREDARVWERAWWETLWEEGWRILAEREHVAWWGKDEYRIGDGGANTWVSSDGVEWFEEWRDTRGNRFPAEDDAVFRAIRTILFRGGPRDGQRIERVK